MKTISQMLAENNRQVRRRHFWREVDFILGRLLLAAVFAGLASVGIALITGHP